MLLALEIIGVIVGLIYLWLEYRASVWLWLTNIIMPVIYIYIYGEAGFYADMGINIYYLVASIYGWAMWLRRGDSGEQLQITHTPKKMILPLTAAFAVAMAVITYILINYTDSTVPYGDSFTTALSIVALYMLARKQVEQWLVWLVVDAVCCGLYLYKGLYPTAALYGLYTILAWVGYLRWLKMIEEQKHNATLPTA
ncbi:MAG: nicotinamide mononucleotide transporter [Rikenellaceae bacterium]|nr:nicotinamide mononucleotide transporter [Rikenellaceae bacterium]